MKQAWPITGERGIAAGRAVIVSLIGSLAIALAGCGSDGGTSAATAAETSNASAGSTTSTPVAATTGTSTTPTTTTSTPTTSTSTSTPTPPPKAATTSSVTLAWVPPTQNSDGSPITNLAGYKIHYGTTSSDYTQTVALQNAGLSRYVVDNLTSGTYYFAITAYNTQGVESAMSGEVTTTVN